MTNRPASARIRRRTPNNASDDGGFILLESIVSLTLIAFIMGSLGFFFVTTIHATSDLRARQSATTVADTTVDQIRAMAPSDTWLGRTSSDVRDEFANAPAAVSSWLSSTSMYPSFDDSGTTTTSPLAMSSSAPITINNVAYTATNYVGMCGVPVDPSKGTACKARCPGNAPAALGTCTPGYPTTGANAVAVANFIRVVVAVTWSGSNCAANTCSYVTATLLSTDTDQNFLLNTAPPAEPVIIDQADQTAAINDSVSLTMSLTANTGVNPNTWTDNGTLPAGLSIDPTSGVISGTVQGPVNSSGVNVTITVTDAFSRQDSDTFKWVILRDLLPTASGGSAKLVVGTAISTVTLGATGGSGGPFTWALQSGGLPSGVTLSGSTLNGTPNTAGMYGATLVVTDSSGRTRPLNLSWTVYAKPTLSGLSSTFRVMPGWSVSIPLTYTCGTGNCTYTASNLPSGVGLTTSGSATSGTAAVTVSGTGGTIYLVGTVASGSTTSWSVSIAASDTTNGTFTVAGTPATATWTYVSASTGVANLSVARGNAIIAQTPSYACAATCTISFAGTLTTSSTTALPGSWLAPDASTTAPSATLTKPAGNGTVWLRGTMPATTTRGTYSVTVTIKDGNNNSLTEPANWIVT